MFPERVGNSVDELLSLMWYLCDVKVVNSAFLHQFDYSTRVDQQ